MLTLGQVSSHINPCYGTGSATVWFMRDDFIHNGMMGSNWLEQKGKLPTNTSLEKTHVCLGAINLDDLEEIFEAMQDERWSPKGEACALLKELGIRHTTMSVGDIIMKGDGSLFLVDKVGFRPLGK